MTNIPASKYPKASAERYKMTADEIKTALDEHNQIVSNLNKRISEIFILKLGDTADFEMVAI